MSSGKVERSQKCVWILPQIFFDVVPEFWLLCPVKILKDLADVTLYIGTQGTGAVVVLRVFEDG